MKGGVPSIMEIESNKLAGGAESEETRRAGVSGTDNDSHALDAGLLIGQSLTYFHHREHVLLITVVNWSKYILRILAQDLWKRHSECSVFTWFPAPKAQKLQVWKLCGEWRMSQHAIKVVTCPQYVQWPASCQQEAVWLLAQIQSIVLAPNIWEEYLFERVILTFLCTCTLLMLLTGAVTLSLTSSPRGHPV